MCRGKPSYGALPRMLAYPKTIHHSDPLATLAQAPMNTGRHRTITLSLSQSSRLVYRPSNRLRGEMAAEKRGVHAFVSSQPSTHRQGSDGPSPKFLRSLTSIAVGYVLALGTP